MPPAGGSPASFNRRHAARTDITVGKSYVADTLRTHRYAIEQERRRIRRRWPLPGPRNRLWALDLTGKHDAFGRSHQILGLIDHGTRRLLTLKPVPSVSSWTLLGYLCLAIGRYGKPRAVRTDNASVFTSRRFGVALATVLPRAVDFAALMPDADQLPWGACHT